MNLKLKFLLFLTLFPALAWALPTDTQQTLNIVAGKTEFNYKTGVNVYEGNVKVDQGTTHLTADRVVTRDNTAHKLEEVIAYGIHQLATYTTTPKPGDETFVAKANTIKYYPLKSLAVLQDKVVVTQGNNVFQGPIIIYNIKDQIVSSPASKDGRVKIVIEPKQ